MYLPRWQNLTDCKVQCKYNVAYMYRRIRWDPQRETAILYYVWYLHNNVILCLDFSHRLQRTSHGSIPRGLEQEPFVKASASHGFKAILHFDPAMRHFLLSPEERHSDTLREMLAQDFTVQMQEGGRTSSMDWGVIMVGDIGQWWWRDQGRSSVLVLITFI